MPGRWKHFYERWSDVTRQRMNVDDIELLPVFRALVPPALVLDKSFYSPFFRTTLEELLHNRGTDTLVFSGTETDVCVLSGVLDAVDRGLRVIVAEDAICSSNDETHEALMKLYRDRFREQIEVAQVSEILKAWN